VRRVRHDDGRGASGGSGNSGNGLAGGDSILRRSKGRRNQALAIQHDGATCKREEVSAQDKLVAQARHDKQAHLQGAMKERQTQRQGTEHPNRAAVDARQSAGIAVVAKAQGEGAASANR
jgi:hypothetical protein